MPSPFPGMNPYLERPGVWEMFHTQLISTLQQQLAAQLAPRYLVHIDNRVYIHEPPADERRLLGRADVGVSAKQPPAAGSGTDVAPAPVYGTVPTGVVAETVRFLEIKDRRGRAVVAVIELLSRSNKYAGPDRDQYLGKRLELLRSRVHLVELDLLRGGPRLPVEGLPECDYFGLVSRADERPRVGIWPWSLREPIPLIPVPLQPGDPDARLDVKAALDQVYDLGHYEDEIYDDPPEPRLVPDDAAWATQFVPATPR